MSDNLTRLKGAERIRKLAGVMLGSDSIKGVEQTLFEVISNSIDRFKKGYGKHIKVIKHTDFSFTVSDEADGLPMDWNENENAYNWDLALKVLYAGDSYKQELKQNGELGNHGLGLTSTQYASEYMTVESYKGDKKYTVKCKKGRPIDKDTKEFICDDDDYLLTKEQGKRVLLIEQNFKNLTGTTIKYKPDIEVFSDIDVPVEWIKNKLKKQVVVNNGLTIELYDESSNDTYEYYYETISDYVKEITNDNNISDIIVFSKNGQGQDNLNKPIYDVSFEFAFTFNNEVNVFEHYHNSSELTDRNSVTSTAIENGMTNAIHKYILDNKLYEKKESKVRFSDIEDSLVCILSSKSSYTSYANQTKLSIDNNFIKTFITDKIQEELSIYLIENPLEAKKIINQILINKRVNEKANKAKLDLKKKLQGDKKNSLSLKLENLKDCDMRNSTLEERIVLVTEGLSPFSVVVDAIDPRIMGVYALTGRFINSLKSTVNDVLNNRPAKGFIDALGCGIEIPKNELKKYKDLDTFDMKLARYGNIGLLCDADAFGAGINLSLLTFIYKFLPTYLKQGRVFIVKTPRFEIETKEKNYYAYDEEEKQKIIKDLENQGIKHEISIKKGLGEFNQDEFTEYVLSEKARKKCFKQVKWIEDENLIEYYFDVLMGDNIQERKDFIYKNIVNIDVSELDV